MHSPEPATVSIIELPSPFVTERGVIRLIEPADCDRGEVLERVRASRYDKPFVFDDGASRSLHFSMDVIQSAMRVDDPDALELAYTRKMMSFLLFVHAPRFIVMFGLGGGSLAKYCHRHLRSTRITVLEIDPRIVAFRGQFMVPPDDSRFEVRVGDAAQYIRRCEDQPDVIMMDAFDRHGYAASTCSTDFYADVRDALHPRGVMVANLVGESGERAAHLRMMREAFGDNILVVPVEDDGNHVALAFRERSFEPSWRSIDREAKAMRSRYGLDFPKFAGKLERSRKLGYLGRVMRERGLFSET